MKEVSVKKQLVDFMIANGNDFRYTDMIKATLKICRGKNYVYTRQDRGFYGTNFSKGSNGYMVNGGGDCGVYKNEQGRWSAKYYTKEDKINCVISRQINILTRLVSKERYVYDTNISRLSERERGTEIYSQTLNEYISRYNTKVESYKSDVQNKIAKAILKLG